MFDDENLPRATDNTIPRKLDALSIESLKEYILELEEEIARVKNEIAKKEKLHTDANKFFNE
jgi:uncharacterized small protein (DUF1192 family)